MSDPRESAHFVKIAKVTSRVSKLACCRGLCSVQRRLWGICVPSLSVPFSLTNQSCGANEIIVEIVGKEYLRKNEST